MSCRFVSPIINDLFTFVVPRAHYTTLGVLPTRHNLIRLPPQGFPYSRQEVGEHKIGAYCCLPLLFPVLLLLFEFFATQVAFAVGGVLIEVCGS